MASAARNLLATKNKDRLKNDSFQHIKNSFDERETKNMIEITNEIYFAHSANDVQWVTNFSVARCSRKKASNDVRLKIVSFSFIFIIFICSFVCVFGVVPFGFYMAIFLDEKRMEKLPTEWFISRFMSLFLALHFFFCVFSMHFYNSFSVDFSSFGRAIWWWRLTLCLIFRFYASNCAHIN